MNRPLVPEDRFRIDYSVTQARSYWRGVTANVLGTIQNENPDKIIERVWGKDEALRTRAVSAPASMTGWGRELTTVGGGPTLITLAPASAAAALYARSTQLDFDSVNQVLVPKVVTPPTGTWVAEGSPAAMVQPVFGSVLVGPPKKLLFGAAITGEISKYAIDTAVTIVQRTLSEAASVALDTALLDNTSADSARPAGLLNGLSSLGATGGGGLSALLGDLEKFAGAFSDAKISAEGMILFMNARQAIALRGLLSPLFATAYVVVGTTALASGTVVAVAPAGVAMFASVPAIETSKDALVHMESASPRNIDTQAVSETVKSAWQANLLVLKVRLQCTWSPLVTGAVQVITSTTW